jgi:hypothetical protein
LYALLRRQAPLLGVVLLFQLSLKKKKTQSGQRCLDNRLDRT